MVVINIDHPIVFSSEFRSSPGARGLWSHLKVTVTLHEAGGTPQGSFTQVAENYRRLVDGQPLINIADPERGY
jgi:glyoxylate/hydroxypyruvate reductase